MVLSEEVAVMTVVEMVVLEVVVEMRAVREGGRVQGSVDILGGREEGW